MNQPSVPNGEAKTGILLVSGFLGAGKTTFLKHLLAWKEEMSDTVVIVNEFGDIGIDGSLLQGEESDVIELTSGCICCTLFVDLTILLKSLWERHNPRWIIIEASGVADPITIISALREEGIKEHIKSLRIITILDADCWEMREVFGQLFYHQIENADMILLNKVDLLDKKVVKKDMQEIHEMLPQTQVVPTIYCKVDYESIFTDMRQADKHRQEIKSHEDLLSDGSIREDNLIKYYDETIPDQEHGVHATDSGYNAFSFQESRPMHKASFEQFIKKLPWGIFRVKGPVRFQDCTLLLNYVGGKTEWSVWNGTAETRLSFVGWDTNSDETISKLKRCVAP
ncbi:MAG: GTP-binding protein [Desulfobacteraceae bacterium]|nr:GTP-binding protein [Desulfobacteraceae bacterium]